MNGERKVDVLTVAAIAAIAGFLGMGTIVLATNILQPSSANYPAYNFFVDNIYLAANTAIGIVSIIVLQRTKLAYAYRLALFFIFANALFNISFRLFNVGILMPLYVSMIHYPGLAQAPTGPIQPLLATAGLCLYVVAVFLGNYLASTHDLRVASHMFAGFAALFVLRVLSSFVPAWISIVDTPTYGLLHARTFAPAIYIMKVDTLLVPLLVGLNLIGYLIIGWLSMGRISEVPEISMSVRTKTLVAGAVTGLTSIFLENIIIFVRTKL